MEDFLQDVVMASGFTVSKSPTASKDKLHHFNLLLSEKDANIYVSSLKIAFGVFKHIWKQMNSLHPKLPDIYCQ